LGAKPVGKLMEQEYPLKSIISSEMVLFQFEDMWVVLRVALYYKNQNTLLGCR
jgi:hypothetical protein